MAQQLDTTTAMSLAWFFFPRDSPVRTKSHSIPTQDFSRTSALGNERALSVPPFEFSPAQSVYLTGLEYDPRNMMYLSFHFCRTAGLEGMDFPSWLRARFSTLLGPSRWRGPTRFERRHRMWIVIDGCRIERNEDINKYGHQRHRKYKKKQKFDRKYRPQTTAVTSCFLSIKWWDKLDKLGNSRKPNGSL